MKATGVDALGMLGSAVHGLGGFDMIALAVKNDGWNISVAELKATLAMGKPDAPQMIGKGELPVTYLFRTREGGVAHPTQLRLPALLPSKKSPLHRPAQQVY